MGQAKVRGTREQRVAQAEERERQEYLQRVIKAEEDRQAKLKAAQVRKELAEKDIEKHRRPTVHKGGRPHGQRTLMTSALMASLVMLGAQATIDHTGRPFGKGKK